MRGIFFVLFCFVLVFCEELIVDLQNITCVISCVFSCDVRNMLLQRFVHFLQHVCLIFANYRVLYLSKVLIIALFWLLSCGVLSCDVRCMLWQQLAYTTFFCSLYVWFSRMLCCLLYLWCNDCFCFGYYLLYHGICAIRWENDSRARQLAPCNKIWKLLCVLFVKYWYNAACIVFAVCRRVVQFIGTTTCVCDGIFCSR